MHNTAMTIAIPAHSDIDQDLEIGETAQPALCHDMQIESICPG